MTRDTWLRRCAQRLIDRGGMDTGEAAATALACAELQESEKGRRPFDWESPEDAADEEMASWDNDGAEDDEP